jgi:hypothetical protein
MFTGGHRCYRHESRIALTRPCLDTANSSEETKLSAARLNQLNRELRDLCTELASLQERALHRVEEIENDFYGVVLSDQVKENFRTSLPCSG